MCGIAGLIDNTLSDEEAHRVVAAMNDVHALRGPDANGIWAAPVRPGPVLGHTRLSIIDLSEAGAQPMICDQGRFAITYNGEIYNHLDLRAELERELGQLPWRGHSDTETLLACIRQWGIEATLPRLNGMFALALWDAEHRRLTLARDRFGEKPLYYWSDGGRFAFGSQLATIMQHPGWRGEVDRGVLVQYLRYNCVHAPNAIFQGVAQLRPAHFIHVDARTGAVSEQQTYWDIAERFVACNQDPFTDDATTLTDRLEELLTDAIGLRMASDVPLGAFLSGGIDSTSIVALMQKQSARPTKTFTIGFHSKGYDEATHAKAVAKHLGTDHTELYMEPSDILSVIPEIPRYWDEPFGDSSQLPTVLVSRLAREHVTVSLSGDAGDELFAGYNRYVTGYKVWNMLRRLPRPVRKGVAAGLHALPVDALTHVLARLPMTKDNPSIGNRVRKLASVMDHADENAFFATLVSQMPDPGSFVLDAEEPDTIALTPESWPEGIGDFREMMMYLDTMGYLPNDILTKVDRASMSISLESRVPFLDPRVAEFAWRTPLDMKLRDGQSKWLLRQVLYRHVPREMVDRSKLGFGVPIEHWLDNELRDWVEALIDPARLRNEGFFDVAKVRGLWDEHRKGKVKKHFQIWTILMFQSWLEHHQSAQFPVAGFGTANAA